jgi:uncharacterized membrane protein
MAARPDHPSSKAPAKPPVQARTRVAVSFVLGCLAAVPVAVGTGWELWPLVSWALTAAIFVAWVWISIWGLDADRTARYAAPEDPTRAAADFLILTASVVSLVAVGFVLGRATSSEGAEQTLLALLGVASVVLSWTVVHTVYTLGYARMYYAGTDGGVDFHGDGPPRYSDFAYLAFTIGMTFQVSDTEVETAAFRAAVLRQSLLSFLFVTGILATTVNLIANL